MKPNIEQTLIDFEAGRVTRRQAVFALTALTAGAVAVPSAIAAPAGGELKAVSINHVTIKVPDIQRSSQFYQEFFGMKLEQHSDTVHILGVGDGFFGIEQGDATPRVDHFDFGIADFNADEVRAKLKARNLGGSGGRAQDTLKFKDPDGFLIQLN